MQEPDIVVPAPVQVAERTLRAAHPKGRLLRSRRGRAATPSVTPEDLAIPVDRIAVAAPRLSGAAWSCRFKERREKICTVPGCRIATPPQETERLQWKAYAAASQWRLFRTAAEHRPRPARGIVNRARTTLFHSNVVLHVFFA
jgi:hypothetical protein